MITTQSFDSSKQTLLCGTTHGFFIWDTLKNKKRISRDFAGGIRIIKTINKTNIIAFVRETTPNSVIIWDDHKKTEVCDIKHKFEIAGVIITQETFIVILPRKIYVYDLREFKLLSKIKTGYNPNGICELIETEKHKLVVFPSSIIGNIVFYNIETGLLLSELSAHNSDIELISISDDPEKTLLFTASSKGTIIRGFDINSLEKRFEFRRGLSSSTIYSMCTDAKLQHLVVCGQTGTTHLYSLSEDAAKKNTKSIFNFAKSILPEYYSSKWSHTTINNKNTNKSIVALKYTDNFLFLIISYINGEYYKYCVNNDSIDLVKHQNIIMTG